MSEQRHGYFGSFGGQFMPETLMNAVIGIGRGVQQVQRWTPDFGTRT